MKEVSDYLRHMFMAVFLYPVAAVFVLAVVFSGFNLGEFMQFLGSLGQLYASMDVDGQHTLLSQGLFSWAVLAFVFVLVSYAVNPPNFRAEFNKADGNTVVSVVELGGFPRGAK